MKELKHFQGMLERYKEMYGSDFTLACLMKAIRRVEEDPSLLGWRKGDLPPAGNECGLHTPFISALEMLLQASVVERQTR